MKAIYMVSFPIASDSGHQGATAEKIAAIRRLGINLYVCACNLKIYNYIKLLALIWVELKSSFLLLKERPDFVISRGYCGFLALIISKLTGVRFVREIHSNLYEESDLIASGIKANIIKVAALYAHFLDRNADKAIFNHPYLARHYVLKYGFKEERVASFYNGVDPKKIISETYIKESSKDGDIVFVGNVSRWHGVNSMLKIFSLAREKGLKNRLKVIGPINDEILPEFSGREDIVFLGRMDNKEVQQHLEQASACFLPVANIRISPGSPLKLYEYLAKAKPVITQKDLAGYSDEVERYNCGICIDFDKPDEAADTIIEFFSAYTIDRASVIEKVRDEAVWDSVVSNWVRYIID